MKANKALEVSKKTAIDIAKELGKTGVVLTREDKIELWKVTAAMFSYLDK